MAESMKLILYIGKPDYVKVLLQYCVPCLCPLSFFVAFTLYLLQRKLEMSRPFFSFFFFLFSLHAKRRDSICIQEKKIVWYLI